MSCRVNLVNKSSGVTYVYESQSYWDKEKKQARNKRVCIGRLDPDAGTFIPSKRLKPEQALQLGILPLQHPPRLLALQLF